MSEFIPIVAGVILLFIGGFMVGKQETENIWKEKLVDRGHAYYCSDNGEWSWKGECTNE